MTIIVSYSCVCGYEYSQIDTGKEQGNRFLFAIERFVLCPDCRRKLYPSIVYEEK